MDYIGRSIGSLPCRSLGVGADSPEHICECARNKRLVFAVQRTVRAAQFAHAAFNALGKLLPFAAMERNVHDAKMCEVSAAPSSDTRGRLANWQRPFSAS